MEFWLQFKSKTDKILRQVRESRMKVPFLYLVTTRVESPFPEMGETMEHKFGVEEHKDAGWGPLNLQYSCRGIKWATG